MLYFIDIIWKNKNLVLNEQHLEFQGNISFNKNILDLESPYEFFSYLFTDDIFEKIVEQSNLYAIQKDPSKPLNITKNEIKHFLGVNLYMSLVHLPNCRAYWSEDLGFEKIKETMTVNRYEKIRRYLHFNDNEKHLPRENPDYDRLHKLRPLIDCLNKNFCKDIPIEQFLSVDEQICSTKARHHLKQYLPNKPHKWGFKFFVLCGVSGYAYNFEMYSGQENAEKDRLINELDLGASANVVVRLTRIVPKNLNYRIYFDNYYTSIPLLVYLAKQGIHSLGTVRRNRVPNCKFPDEKSMRNEDRGKSFEMVASCDGVDISGVVWKDNKTVTLLSTFAGESPIETVQRYDRKQKKTVNINCPFVIREYNRHMGGVDLLDSNLGRVKILRRSKKWYFRVFYHLLDLTVANSWILYKRVHQQKGIAGKCLTQAKFRSILAATLCSIGQTKIAAKRGRPSTEDVEQKLQLKKKRGPAVVIPVKEVRTDGTNHWPVWLEKQMRCKFPDCKGYSQVMCEKCGASLCFNKKKNCFKDFHN